MKAKADPLSTAAAPEILYEDNHLLVVNKPAGMLVQEDDTGDLDLLTWGKGYLKAKYAKPGNVYLGLVHRLDRPVSGVVALGRTSKAAARLSEQFRTRAVEKIYWALAEGEAPPAGELRQRIARGPGKSSRTAGPGEGKHAELAFRRLAFTRGVSWLEVTLGTGRHHQIRLQLSGAGLPILGDVRYGARTAFGGQIALHARSLAFDHPVKEERLRFEADPPVAWAPYLTSRS